MSILTKTFAIAFQLSSVGRFSRDHMAKQENVLEHIGFCCFYAFILAQRLEVAGTKVDYKKLMARVAAHDLDEALLGDIPRTTKYFNFSIREGFARVERKTIERIDRWLKTSFLTPWIEAKQGLEGQILKVTDIASVVYKNWAEIELLRNHSFIRVCLETNDYLNSLVLDDYHPVLAFELEGIRLLNAALIEGYVPTEEDKLFIHFKEELADED